MSCFSYVRSFSKYRVDSLKTLVYWFKKPLPFNIKIKFILTKIIEITAFMSVQHPFPGEVSKERTKHFSLKSNANSVPLNPNVSVVVPVYVKDDFSRNCLFRLIKALKSQTYKIDNIILVDDYSPVKYPTPENVYFYQFSQNLGPAAARNKGIDISLDLMSDIILFTDVDCLPEGKWVENIVQAFQEDRTASIISGTTKSLDSCWFGKYHEINGTLNGRIFLNNDFLLYGPTCNIGITAEVGKKIRFSNSFTTAAGEDIDFCFKALNSGFRIKYEPNVIVHHDFGYNQHDIYINIKKFISQFKRYAKGESVLLNQIPDYYHFFHKTVEISSYEN